MCNVVIVGNKRKGSEVDKERIEEIRERCDQARAGKVLFDAPAAMSAFIYSMDLLDALEAEQEENARLREALAKAEEKACRLVNFSGGIDCQMTIVEKCSICQAVFKNMHRKHADDCPFKILES